MSSDAEMELNLLQWNYMAVMHSERPLCITSFSFWLLPCSAGETRVSLGDIGKGKESCMNGTTLSRRSFVKMAAAAAVTTGMAASLGAGGLAKADEAAKVGETKRVRTCCRGCGKMECGV